MITEIGKFLRILRISKEESAKDMAEKLGVSSSYLSAIELGKRDLPSSWENLIIEKYNLDEKNKEKLHNAVAESLCAVKIDFSNVDKRKKDLILSMAKTDLPEETIDKLCEIIKNK